MIGDEDERNVYKWEHGMSRTWDAVQEDAEGNIVTSSVIDRERLQRSKRYRVTESIQRGLIRYVLVLLDCSLSALEKDIRPSRFEASKNAIERFIGDFYDQNPISQLSLALTRDRTSEKVTELSGNPKNHINTLKQIIKADGLASLQNSLLLAMAILRHIPDYGHRELIIVYNSISTCDPGDIFNTIEEVKKLKIRCSVISTCSELYICSKLASMTNGTYTVARDSGHLMELLLRHSTPPPELQEHQATATDFVYMGFPKQCFDSTPVYVYEGRNPRLASASFNCPRCLTRCTDIPTQCCVCGLQLNSSSHIARSFHHLFPVKNFVEVPFSDNGIEKGSCTGCLESFDGGVQLQCLSCKGVFCVDCDLFIHDSLHNCPGCTS